MATVNKQSLREEFDSLKAEFERLCAAGTMAAESRALFQAMLMLFEVLMAVFMERRTSKNSNNSSIPPSQTSKDETTPPGHQQQGSGAEQYPLQQHPHGGDRSHRQGQPLRSLRRRP
jgi:hypothetical protein